MKPMTLDENRQVQLGILSAFADFCEKNELRYFLAYGTLLGAVRHKGYIPWDDDIDVHMPREDYEKFIYLFKKENKNDQFVITTPQDSHARHSFVKMSDTRTAKIEKGVEYSGHYLGIDIDVWPLDGQPEDYKTFEKRYKKLKLLYFMFFARITKLGYGSLKRRVKVLALRMVSGSKKSIINKTEKIHRDYPYATSPYVGTQISFRNPLCDRYPKEWFREQVLLDFEGYKFKAPVDYDKILTQRYGDYMQLPPLEEQVTHHSNNVFWKE